MRANNMIRHTAFFMLFFILLSFQHLSLSANPDSHHLESPYALNVIETFEALPILDFAYDSSTEIAYVVVNDSGETESDDYILMINGRTGETIDSFFVGKNPRYIKIANNNAYLYINYDNNMIKRIGLADGTTDLTFSIGTISGCGPLRVGDLVIFDTNPEIVAIARQNSRCSPDHEGVFVYDNGVQLPNFVDEHSGATELELSGNPTILYGFNSGSTEFGFRQFAVDADGITLQSNTQGLIGGFRTTIKYHNGLIYSSYGDVVDPTDNSVVTKYSLPDRDRFDFTIDADNNRIFFIMTDFIGVEHIEMVIFELDSGEKVGDVDLSPISHLFRPDSFLNFEYVGDNQFLLATDQKGLSLFSISELADRTYLPTLYSAYCPGPFTDDFSDPTSGWPTDVSGTSLYRYLNGEYNVFHQEENRWTAIIRGDEWERGANGVRLNGRIAQNDGIWGIIYGLNDDWTAFNTFEINPATQQYFLLNFSSSTGWKLLDRGSSPAIQTGANQNEISLVRQGLSLDISVNDTFILRANEKLGRVGLTGASFTENVDIRYDDYLFAGVNCDLMASAQNQSLPPMQNITLERPAALFETD